MNILITGVGGPTVRSIAKSIRLSERLGTIKLIGVDANPLCHGLYESNLYDRTLVVPKATEPTYWSVIHGIIETFEIDLAIIQPEREIMEWSNYKSIHAKYPCNVLLPDPTIISSLIDKSEMTEALANSGLVPKSVSFEPLKVDATELAKHINYPYWVRGVIGSSGLGSLKVEKEEDLHNWITINPAIQKFIASTYLPGRNLACKLLYYNGQLIRAACGERVNYIMSNVAPSGITGNTSFGRLINEPELIEKATAALEVLFEKTNAEKHGFFTADFKEDSAGIPYLTEINARMVAFNLSFAKAGANFTEDIIRLSTDDPTFDRSYKMYEFQPGTIFLRDVDSTPILMNEKDLLH